MRRYYTRVCNFYYGKESRFLVEKKKTLPINQNISFDHLEILTRNSKKIISIKKIKDLSKLQKKQVFLDLKNIQKEKKNFANLDFQNIPNIMGILNLTPDSFSDGGRFSSYKKGIDHALKMFKAGANIIDVGGESTRPGSKTIDIEVEWTRIRKTIKYLSKKIPLSLDTRKSEIMERGINYGIKIINDVSGLSFDTESINKIKKYKIPFIIQHSQGTPQNMQINPKYKNELLDIYDYFEKKINFLRSIGIKHNNIIIDPGIGFGKNLKHNMNLMSNISIFHSLGFPILVGISRKRFIKDLTLKNDTKKRIGGTVASSIYLMMQGVQILRIHDVNELLQGLKVFKKLLER